MSLISICAFRVPYYTNKIPYGSYYVFYFCNEELGKEDFTLVYHLFRDLKKKIYDLFSAIVLNSVEDPAPEALMPI
jgi:hypothetical protein